MPDTDNRSSKWHLRRANMIETIRHSGVLLLLVLITGCTAVKQCAYEGFNRDSWQHPQRVIDVLDIPRGSQIADIGSGSGYFTLRLARAAGIAGKVYAVDVDRDMNVRLRDRLNDEALANVEIIEARPEDPMLPPAGVDLIFTSNTYHHLEDRARYFANVRKYLRPGGRIAIIDFREGMFRHFTPAEVIKGEMQEAGYQLQQEYEFLPRQHFLVFYLEEK